MDGRPELLKISRCACYALLTRDDDDDVNNNNNIIIIINNTHDCVV